MGFFFIFKLYALSKKQEDLGVIQSKILHTWNFSVKVFQ